MNKLVRLMNRSLILSTERINLQSQIPRFLSSTNVMFDSKTNALHRRLGIPERPKRPLSAYFRYYQEIRPALQQSGKSAKEVPAIAATKWKSLDNAKKQKYIQDYEKERAAFLKQKESYEKSLTKDQKLILKDERVRLREEKEERDQKLVLKNRLKELGKPKKPLSAFVIYYADAVKKEKTNVLDVKAKYDKLDESQKAVYKQKAAALSEEYKKALSIWQNKMAKKGLTDLIGKKAASKLAKNK